MFKLYDGRESFYQWDKDRKLIVYDDDITEVHFCNKTEECSLKAETYKEGNLTLVNVPNVLLQQNWAINVYAYDSDYTKHCNKFKVIARSKPEDYIYTEEELKQWQQLQQQLEALESKVDNFNTDALEAQLEEVEKHIDRVDSIHKADFEAIEATLTNAEEAINESFIYLENKINNISAGGSSGYSYTYDGNLDNAIEFEDGIYFTRIADVLTAEELKGAMISIIAKENNTDEIGVLGELEITEEYIFEQDDVPLLYVATDSFPIAVVVKEDFVEGNLVAEKGLYFICVNYGTSHTVYCSLLEKLGTSQKITKLNEEIVNLQEELETFEKDYNYHLTQYEAAAINAAKAKQMTDRLIIEGNDITAYNYTLSQSKELGFGSCNSIVLYFTQPIQETVESKEAVVVVRSSSNRVEIPIKELVNTMPHYITITAILKGNFVDIEYLHYTDEKMINEPYAARKRLCRFIGTQGTQFFIDVKTKSGENFHSGIKLAVWRRL